jgi:hypothetical protein
MDNEVIPKFGNSLLVLSGRSQLPAETGKVIREPSVVLVLFYSATDERNAAVEDVRSAFRDTFQHATVPRVDSRACVAF